jgi:hypothetical protein
LEKNLREKSGWWVKYNVSPYSYDKLEDEPLNKKFEELSWYKAWGTPNTKTPGPKEFVHGTSKRLYVLNAFLKKTGYEDIIHIENDVMVYESLDFVVKKAREVYDRFAATIVGPDYMACSFCYIPQPEHLNDVCEFMIPFLEMGDAEIKRRHPGVEMTHEMTLLRLKDDIYYFPSLPTDDYAAEFDYFLFDPAGWGQYVGGTNTTVHGPGYAGSHHYIGKKILDGTYKAEMKWLLGDNVPIVVDQKTGEKFPLVNLHIHCKDLERFLSS